MKRRRPWTAMSVVATAAAVVLSSGIQTAALAEPPPRIPSHRFFSNNLNLRRLETEIPIEEDVTPYPSPYYTTSLQPTNDDSTQAPSGALVKNAYPVQFDFVLQVTANVALNDLLRDIANVLEEYIFTNMQALEQDNPALSLKGVSLFVTAAARRRLRSLQFTQTVNLDVQGGILLDIRPTADNDVTDVLSNVSTEAQALLTAPNVKQVIEDANIDSVIAVVDENTLEQVDQKQTTEPRSETIPSALNNTTDDNGALEKPSLLSIIFGFVLVAIAAAGLLAYCYIFYRKRQKKLAKRRKMRESVQYQPSSSRKATTTTPKPARNSVAPALTSPPILALPPPAGKIPNSDDDNEDSEGSSYKGIGSGSEDDGAGKDDFFARELQTAASLDEQAWENFQQKKQRSEQQGRVISRNNSAEEPPYSPAHSGSLAMYSAQTSDSLPDTMPNDPEESPRYAKSFPYGDEEGDEEFLTDEGVEWTTEGMDLEANSWEPYSSKVKVADRPKTSTVSSLAAIQAIERSLGQYGSADVRSTDDNDDAGLATSDAVQEVERLSRFVQRYEKKKERRIAREQERRSRSFVTGSVDYDELSGASRSLMGRSIDSTQAADHVSHLDTTYSESPRGMDSYSGYGSLRDEKKTDTGAPSLLHEAPSLSMDETEVTEFTELHTMSEGNDVSQRLGITPFRVQKPVELESDDDDDEGPISPMMQKLGQAEAARNARMAPRDGDSLPTDERRDDRRSKPQELNEQRSSRQQQLQTFQNNRRRAAQQQAGRRRSEPPQQSKSLTSLRDNSAVVDKKPSKSLAALRNTNKAFVDNPSDSNFSPSDEEYSGAPSTAQKPSPKLAPPRELPAPTNPPRRRSGKVDDLRNLFETEEKAPIYPPDQHWQYTGKLSNSRSKSFGN
jgi:hypothetical protein